MTKEEAIKELQEAHDTIRSYDIDSNESRLMTALNMAIKALEQEPKTGHWVNAKVGKLFPSNDFKCSNCGNILDFNGVNCGRGDANFCPNCGVKMVEPRESEDKE